MELLYIVNEGEVPPSPQELWLRFINEQRAVSQSTLEHRSYAV